MPFTPFHMGPGLLIKSLLQGSFSLMVFGWAQIVMDVQPLIAMTTGLGKLHGFTHTYIGATVLAIFSAMTGKYLSEWALRVVFNLAAATPIRWWVAVVSGFIGTYSHVLLDSIMHSDLQPWAPFSAANPMLGYISVQALHKLCVYSAAAGALSYFAVARLIARQGASNSDVPPDTGP